MEYEFKDNTFFATPKDHHPDRIDLEVGDSKETVFQPQIKLMRWDNEVNASFRLLDFDNFSLDKKGDEIILAGDKKEVRFYEAGIKDAPEGGFEFDVILKEKPLSNKLEFSMQTKGLNFQRQLSLTEEPIPPWGVTANETDVFDENGKSVQHRPENVIGSYAVYHQTKGVINSLFGKEYKAGKAFHIYRPKIVDSAGHWVWGELNIDVENGLLVVTIPDDFLMEAVYPIKQAAGAIFGYNTQGLSNTSPPGNSMVGTKFTSPADMGTVSDMKLYAGGGGGGKFCIVLWSTKVIITNGISNASSAATPEVATFGTNPTPSATTAYLLSYVYAGSATVYYDGSADDSWYDSSNSNASPTDPTDGFSLGTTYKFSIWCDYTAAGGGTAVKDIIQPGIIPFAR